jgi:cytoskeleton protein RodZ
MDEERAVDAALFPERVGDRLRAARIKAGLDLQDVATRTRVPLRHLTAIENGELTSLPSSTYSMGFAKAYAKAVGEDEVEIANAMRLELGKQPPVERYEPHFVDEEPSGSSFPMNLVWTAVGILALLVAAYGIWRANSTPDGDSVVAEGNAEVSAEELLAQPATNAAAAQTAPTAGEVVLTAAQPVWVRIYDAGNKVLFEKEMTVGERFLVPADANKPMIRTGRPDMLSVTVAGKPVPTLGPAERMIKDVEISAVALAARPAPAPVPTAASPAATTPVP